KEPSSMARHQILNSLVVAIILVAPGAGLADQPTDEADAARVGQLIRQLGSDQFRERQQASKELEAIGEPAWAALIAVACSDDPEIRHRAQRIVQAIEKRQQLRSFIGHTESVHRIAFSPDGRRALSAAKDNTIRLWDVATGKEIRRLEGHTNWVVS